MTTKLTVAQLNDIQDAWMDLKHDAPLAEKQRVFKLMEAYPKAYLSSSDGIHAVPFISECPCWADGRPIKEALDHIKDVPGALLNVAWNGAIGRWVSI